jgi:hypothetical protein
MRIWTAILLSLARGPAVEDQDPLADYGLPWTASVRWDSSVTFTEFPGKDADEKLRAAQEAVAAKGGGVVRIPAGRHVFREDILLKSGVVLRGETPAIRDARLEAFEPPSRIEFPRYAFSSEGRGTPIGTAFKGIRLEDPAAAERCGILHLFVERGHVHFEESPERKAGRDRFVVGCVFRNAAQAAKDVPDAELGQLPWQRWTNRFGAAVSVRSGENVLIAANRIPESGEDNFLQEGYLLQDRKKAVVPAPAGILFDYDNRPGIAANDAGLGGGGASDPNGTPETHPWGFRKGMVIRDNYVFATGRCAITFTGDGVLCLGNVIRFKKDVVRWTTTGKQIVGGTGTNDNRGVQMRGWRWRVEDNDFEVWRNKAADTNYYINDGEGLMHEDHVNSTVLDSKLIRNRGNSYLSIYKTAGIRGLELRGNEIRTAGGIAAIYVVANRNAAKFECRDVLIVDNVTSGSGITIAGEPASGNVVRGNRHEGPGGKLQNDASAEVVDNRGYE